MTEKKHTFRGRRINQSYRWFLDAAVQVLHEAGEPLPSRSILERVVSRGTVHHRFMPKSTIAAAQLISRDELRRFVRMDVGCREYEWGLRRWTE